MRSGFSKMISPHIIAIIGFFSLSPYFVWSSYAYSIIFKVFYIFCYLLLQVFFFIDISKGSFRIKKENFIKAIVLGLIIIFTTLFTKGLNVNGYLFNFLFFITVIEFIQSHEEVKRKAFSSFLLLFTLSLIPGLIVLFINLFGLTLPYSILESTHSIKVDFGIYYLKYFGSIFMSNSVRLCAMYNEPGVVGTISALLLAGNLHSKDWKNIILGIAGVLSFSLAFIVLIGFSLIIRQKRASTIFRIFIIIISILLIFNYLTEVGIVKYDLSRNGYNLLSRLEITDKGLAGDNRVSDSGNYGFNMYLKQAPFSKLFFGNGWKSASKVPFFYGGYSYKFIIYDIGILGFILYIAGLVCLALFGNKWTINKLGFLFTFLFSIYQRPYVLSMHFIIILIGGIELIDYYEKNPKSINGYLKVDTGEGI